MMACKPMDWDPAYTLGNAEVDSAHREFVRLIDAMLAADAASFDASLAAFAAHAKQHFDDEDRLMAQSVYDNARCHIDEHHAVLASVDEVRALPEDRRASVGHRLAQELARWFPGHLDVMDRGVVDWVVRHRTGAAPLTFLPKSSIVGRAYESG